MTEYIPGQQIKEFIKSVQPPAEYDAEFEYGYYDGEYVVAGKPEIPFLAELEKIRDAASTLWQNQLIPFADLILWVKNGAVDPLTDEQTMQVTPGDEQKKTVLLIVNGVFVRHW